MYVRTYIPCTTTAQTSDKILLLLVSSSLSKTLFFLIKGNIYITYRSALLDASRHRLPRGVPYFTPLSPPLAALYVAPTY